MLPRFSFLPFGHVKMKLSGGSRQVSIQSPPGWRFMSTIVRRSSWIIAFPSEICVKKIEFALRLS